jgi:tripartite-type tricarboxylate transporter receptor subunit TctC
MKLISALAPALAFALYLSSPFVAAQDFPNRAITLVVPFPAGSATDATARRIGQELSKLANVPVVVDNKPGADGNIAAMHVLRSDPDGYTVFVTTNSTHAANVNLFKSLPFDPVNDFAPVTGLVTIPIMLVVRQDSPIKTIADYIEQGRRTDNPPTFGTSSQTGRGAGELFKSRSKLNIRNVPYRGSPQALTDLVGGHVDSLFVDPVAARGLMQKGDIRALAVTSARRAEIMPSVPTLAESGLAGFELTAWVAAFVPAKTPAANVTKLNSWLTSILKDPATVSFLTASGATPFPTSPEQLAAHAQSDTRRWAQVVEAAGMEKQ